MKFQTEPIKDSKMYSYVSKFPCNANLKRALTNPGCKSVMLCFQSAILKRAGTKPRLEFEARVRGPSLNSGS